MKISKRLKMIADMVDKSANVIDIGCDHGLLDIYLTLYNDNNCIASDISENALENAKSNIKRYNLEDKIKTVVSDGTKNIDMNLKHILILSGMGTQTIINIIENSNLTNTDKIIIQSNNDLFELRKYMTQKGYIITSEKVVYDKNIYYIIIKFENGKIAYSDKELTLGPILLNKNDSDTTAYFNYILNKNLDIINKIDLPEQKQKFIEQNKWITFR